MNSIRICLNIMKRLFKDPVALSLILIVPLLGGVLSSFMFNKDTLIKIAITDSDYTSSVINLLEDTNKYKIEILSEEDIEKFVNNKSIEIGIIVSYPYEKTKILCKRQNGNVNELNLLLDSYFKSLDNPRELKNIDINLAVKDNSKDNYKLSASVGFLLMSLFMFSGTCTNILIDDINSKTFMRIFCARLKSHNIIFGHILASIFLSSIQIFLFLVLSKYVLHMDYRITSPVFFINLMAFFIASLGINIALTSLIKTTQALSIINFVLAGCFCAVGGTFIPVSSMSPALQTISSFIPNKWLMESYDKLSNGSSFKEVYINILILLLFGAVFSTFGIKTLRFYEED